jgi:adenosylhomocysteinase
MRAKALGAKVTVCEINPFKAIEASMDGFEVMKMEEAATKGDLFITATGCRQVIDSQHLKLMKNGAILANAGHFDVEVNKEALNKMAKNSYEARINITCYELEDGRSLYLLAEGRLVNLAAGDGHVHA